MDGQVPTQNESVIVNAGGGVVQLTAGSYALQSVFTSSPIEITNGATLVLNGRSVLTGGLTVDTGGLLQVVADPVVLVVNGANFTDNGTVDLTDNDLIVQNGDLSAITAQIASGFNGGYWTGVGITSSSAAGTHNMALGVELNDDGTGTSTPLMTSFDGQPTSDGDVLIKYTLFGDANLDGVVNAADYSLIDDGFNNGGALIGWRHGDFNYDGLINGDDYTLIDNAFNTQESTVQVLARGLGASNAAQIANAVTASATNSHDSETRRGLVVGVSSATTGNSVDGQELKKRRPSAWEMLES